MAKGKRRQSGRAALQKPAGNEEGVLEETTPGSEWMKYGVTGQQGQGLERPEMKPRAEQGLPVKGLETGDPAFLTCHGPFTLVVKPGFLPRIMSASA